jgi:phosphoglucosamine mutase
VVIDCANGAGYKVAPTALWELGAEVFSIGVEPDGFNINDKCGSTAPEKLSEKVRELRADIGIALDGDADRVVVLDETGKVVDGDQLLALIATAWAETGQLTGGGIVATVMSNLGLERHLASRGLKLERTKVGDRYVVEHMRAHGFNVGGEQSGHIVLSDFSTTGDGLIAALQVLAMVRASGKTVSQVCAVFEPVPQVLKNVRCRASGARAAAGAPGHRRGDRAAGRVRPAGDPSLRHRADDPGHGGRRRRAAGQCRWSTGSSPRSSTKRRSAGLGPARTTSGGHRSGWQIRSGGIRSGSAQMHDDEDHPRMPEGA